MTRRILQAVIPAVLLFAILSPISLLKNHAHRFLTALSETTDDGATKEPSHIELCRAIVSPNKEELVVEEDPKVCRDRHTPFASTVQVFVSTFLAEVSRKNDLGVSYKYHCRDRNRKLDEVTVQETLDLKNGGVLPESTNMNLENVRTICDYCINAYETENDSSPKCILFSKHRLSEDGKLSSQTSRRMVEESVGMEFLLPSIKRHLNEVAAKYDGTEDKVLSKMAVIYLQCEEEEHESCRTDNLEGFEDIIAKEVPNYVKAIDVIASVALDEKMSKRARDITHWTRKFFPRADNVKYKVAKSTAQLYGKLMKARYVVCSTGTSCILPAISSENFASIVKSSESAWVQKLPLGPSVNFIDNEFKNKDCLTVRGRSGQWVRDLSVAEKSQYKTPLDNLFGAAHREFKPTKKNPFLPSSTYVWEDKHFPQCEVQVISRRKFCKVMKKLGLKRIFFVGDSLSKQMAESLWKLLDYKTDPGHYKWSQTIQCAGELPDFELTYIRNNFLTEVNLGTNSVSLPWAGQYVNYPGKTLLIANVGPHVHDIGQFKKQSFQVFFDMIEQFKRPQDIVYFRTSVPGHPKCMDHDKPFKDYGEYMKAKEKMSEKERNYSWDNFVIYNEWVSQHLNELRKRNKGPNVEVLDIYHMGVLRPDGHRNEDDCLHYNLPGPIDWWNHFLFSQLLTKANMQ